MNESYPLFERFKQEMNPPFERLGLEQLLPREYTNPTAPMVEPTRPMDVVFKPSIGEQAREMAVARDVHGIDLNKNALSPYQAGQLSLQDRKLEQTGALAERRMNDTEKRTLISEIRENKNLPDSEKIKMMADVESGQITQRGQIESRLVGERGKVESGHITERGAQDRLTEGTRQTGRESLEETQARHAKELAALKIEAESKTSKLPSQQRTAKLLRAETAKNTNPEWSPYIKTIPGGGYTITTPGVFTGPSKETYDAIIKFIENDSPTEVKPVAKSPEEIKISPDAAKLKSRFQVSVRDSK